MSNFNLDKTYTVKQLLKRLGILLLIAIPIYIFMMLKFTWEHQYVNSDGPFKWDKKLTEVCDVSNHIPAVDENKVEFDIGSFVFKPATRYINADVLATNPECIGYLMRKGLYGGKEASLRRVLVNTNNKIVAEITVIYTDTKEK
jgi:hypothetical protein